MTKPASFGRLIVAAALVGVLAAGVAVAVRFALDRGLDLIYGESDVVAALGSIPEWLRLLAPMLGGLAAGGIAALFARRGAQGVADVMEAVALGRGRPKLRHAIGPALGSVAAALGGGSIGREGPLIQLGAGVGDTVGMLGGETFWTLRDRRALVAAGTAAGFAAAYNTPIAAVLFVLEVVLGVVTLDVLIPVGVATAIGTGLTRLLIGGGPIYGVRAFELGSSWELLAFVILGCACAVASVGFMKLLGFGEKTFHRLKLPRPIRAAIGGLLVGLIAIVLPEVAGNGYEPVKGILDGRFTLGMLLILAIAKSFATTFSVSSGSPGGVFTPTMLLGACLGAALGGVMTTTVMPFDVGETGAYALVGMASAVAATTHAPLMATLMAFELSTDYSIVLPLLLATAVATLLARYLQTDSIYTAELNRRGVPWQASLGERIARSARAKELMEPAAAVVSADEPLEKALERLAETRGRLVYVTGAGPVRAISLTTAKTMWAGLMRGAKLPAGSSAGDWAQAVIFATPDDSLVVIGEKLWSVDWGELPVVDPTAPDKLLGVVTRRGLLGAFDRELLQREALFTRVQMVEGEKRTADYLELPDGHRVALVAPPPWMVGKAPDIGLVRARFGITWVAIQRDSGGNAPPRWHDPDPEIIVGPGDRLMLVATDDELARFQTS